MLGIRFVDYQEFQVSELESDKFSRKVQKFKNLVMVKIYAKSMS